MRISRFSPASERVARILAAILICTCTPLGLHAKDPCNARILAAKVPPPPPPPLPCDPPKPGDPPQVPANIADGTRLALACAWIDTPPGHDGTDHILEAFRLLTTGPPPLDVDKKVFGELHQASADNDYLFLAALGNPGEQPAVPSLPDFLDILAKANTLPKPSDEQKLSYTAALLNCTQDLINDLFKSKKDPDGPITIAQINDSFGRKNKYVAIYRLLSAVWEQNDASHLEKLRAAFDTNADDLASQVAAKVTATKK